MKESSENKTRLVIFGAGGHAKSVISVALAQGCWEIVGLVVDFIETEATNVLGYPILLGRENLLRLRASGVKHAFIAVGNDIFRQKISHLVKSLDFELVNIIHPSALVMPEATLEEGILLHAYSIVGAEAKISSGVIIQPFVSIGHESHVGSFTQLSPGARVGGDCRIGKCCFLGPNSVIHPKVFIGESVAVAANCTVNRDVPSHRTILIKSSRVISKRDQD